MASPDPTAVTAALNATRALNLAREANDAAVGITRSRGVASGYAPLDGSGLVPVANLGGEVLHASEFTTLGGILVATGAGTFVELLPTGSGQTLESDPGEPSGLVWTTPRAANSNRYLKAGTTNYTAYYCANLASGVALTTKALVANRIYAMPYVAPDRGGTIDELEVYVTTGVAATNLRIGIYENLSEAGLYPGALLIDGGAFTSTTSSQKRTASISQALTPGELYWFSVLSDGAPTIRGGSTNQASHLLGTASSANTTYTTHLYANLTYAALPSTFPTAGATAATGSFPGVFFRMSA